MSSVLIVTGSDHRAIISVQIAPIARWKYAASSHTFTPAMRAGTPCSRAPTTSPAPVPPEPHA